MRKIIPYRTQRNALAALDNGGRFYNIFTQTNDGVISASELAKVAGVYTDKQKMFLYFEMSLSELFGNEADTIRASLSEELKIAYKSYKPAIYTPAQAIDRGKASNPAIITGVPHYVKSNSYFNGFTMVPVCAGKGITFVLVPITDYYDVYEVHDLENEKKFIIAHTRGAARIDKQPTRFGGILKTLQNKKGSKSNNTLFLEALYYSPCSTNINLNSDG